VRREIGGIALDAAIAAGEFNHTRNREMVEKDTQEMTRSCRSRRAAGSIGVWSNAHRADRLIGK